MPANYSELSWWVFSTVIVALIINIASSYIKSRLDAVLSNWSAKRKFRNLAEKEKFEELINEIIENPEKIHYYYITSLRWQINTFISIFILAISFLATTILWSTNSMIKDPYVSLAIIGLALLGTVFFILSVKVRKDISDVISAFRSHERSIKKRKQSGMK